MVPCDLVLVATPIDLARIINIKKPTIRANYEIEEQSKPTLREVLAQFTDNQRSAAAKGVAK